MTKTNIKISMILLAALTGFSPAAYAISSPRDNAIDMTISGMSPQPATRLEPIKIKVSDVIKTDELTIARALHLYNQRKLKEAKGELAEVLISAPSNRAAAQYMGALNSKIEAVKKPNWLLEEEIKGITSVEKSQMGGIYGKEEFGKKDDGERFTTNTILLAAKTNQAGPDSTDKFIAEGMKLEGRMGDYRYTATANLNYYNKDSARENVRLMNATWWMKNEKVQLILGDTSSYLSRYVLNGVNYRGVDVKMDLYQSLFGDVKDNLTLLYGKTPYFWLTEDKYIYPRDIVGIRNELDVWEWWELNANFSYLWDSSSRITKINSNNKAKQNGVLSIDQVIRLIPDVWSFSSENAFSYCDEDREADGKILRSNANYLVSDFKTRTVKVYNSYERIDPNFRSYLGLTGFSANNQVTVDREHWTNFVDFTPHDEIDLGLQYSKSRSNLNKAYNVQTIEENDYKANLKIMPKNGLPRFSLRGSIWTTIATPTSVDAPQEQSNWDSFFEMEKKLWETDWSAAFGVRGYGQFINATHTYGDALEQVFSLSANRRIFDRIEITPSYSYGHARLKRKPNTPSIANTTSDSHEFDLHMSSGLWDTASVTFDYNLSKTEDLATPYSWGTNNAFTATFSWPFTTTLGFKKKLVFSPFLSYHYSDGKVSLLDRRYFAGRLEGDYFLTDNSKLNLSGEYRDNVANDPSYGGFYGDEYRFIISYKTVNGF